ncbi:TIGR02678 family protein [Allosaccharopolyspora coralli]|uniref:TIGR02678 family protein n=1 Tax=Allosaccharopolyspora coralli TaxID=2665642 RepID=A0A5Q3QA31_9PSEU|nr:TIGR02678 family protein [Allosaccharopolyspora coralli]QGK70720.1 TIGR02678 family protein [Allosaccharopolyspora coralli]
MSAVDDVLASSRAGELRRAARALLRRPLVRASGPEAEAFVLIRRHAATLREWFDRNTGWALIVEADLARLVKYTSHTDDPTYPAREARSKPPFTRRRYVLTCLALATLDRAETQITLGRLAEQIVLGAGDPDLVAAGMTFTLEGRDERSDLVAVVRLLLDLGVLSRVAGDEDAFVKDTGDVLYDVHRRVLAGLLATPRGPSTVATEASETFEDRISALTAETPATTDDLRNRRIRHHLTRRLLDEPVLYYDELDEAERTYLSGQRTAITTRITELTGLVAETRAEGIAMVDPFDDLTDVRMPETGTEGHATLLLADHLARSTESPVPLERLHRHVREQADAHRSYWRRDAAEPGAEVGLTTAALDRLEALRLISRDAETVTALPALARYALAEPTVHSPQERP